MSNIIQPNRAVTTAVGRVMALPKSHVIVSGGVESMMLRFFGGGGLLVILVQDYGALAKF